MTLLTSARSAGLDEVVERFLRNLRELWREHTTDTLEVDPANDPAAGLDFFAHELFFRRASRRAVTMLVGALSSSTSAPLILPQY